MRKDYSLGALAGFLTGICLIPTVWNIGYQHVGILSALPIVGAFGIIFGIWLGKVLSGFLPVMFQVSKFAAVGFLNTAINFGVLNLFSIVTGVTGGLSAGGINIPGTIIAASNSYIWNKIWVFQKIDNQGFFNDVPKFALVTILGLLVNSVIIILFTSFIPPLFDFDARVWLNIGKFIATILGILVDFIGYKFLVFRKAK
jgi:putative flippase GtrA